MTELPGVVKEVNLQKKSECFFLQLTLATVPTSSGRSRTSRPVDSSYTCRMSFTSWTQLTSRQCWFTQETKPAEGYKEEVVKSKQDSVLKTLYPRETVFFLSPFLFCFVQIYICIQYALPISCSSLIFLTFLDNKKSFHYPGTKPNITARDCTCLQLVSQ